MHLNIIRTHFTLVCTWYIAMTCSTLNVQRKGCIKGNTKFWEILKIGWIVILYNFDIFGCPCGCIISTRKFSPETTSAFEKNLI